MLSMNDLFKRNIALLLHESFCNSNISRATEQTTVETIQRFLGMFNEHVRSELQTIYGNNTSGHVHLMNFGHVMEKTRLTLNSFDTDYKRAQIFSALDLFFDPVEYELGKTIDYVNVNGKAVVSRNPVTAQFISLKQTLTTTFGNRKFLSEVKNYYQQLLDEEEYLTSSVQGEYWRKRVEEHHADKFVLPLLLYHDDFEPGNALGSHAGTNALGVLYASIPCLPPQYSSCLDFIYPVLIFRAPDRKKFGNAAVFEPAICELKDLETTGINAGSEKIFFEVIQITGDNKGLNSIFGITDCFSANHCCRICKIDRQLLRCTVYENSDLLRTVDNYNEDLERCDPSSTGIHESCIFHDLPNFHMCVNLVVDVLHDLAEGACSLTMQAVVPHLIKSKLTTLENINNRIQSFRFNEINESNKPPVIKSADSLKMSANEMLTFCRYFGLIVGDLVEDDDEFWQMYLKLRQLIDILTGLRLLKGHANQVKVLVAEHNQLFIDLVGPLTPKLHFLEHYSRIIALFGPPVCYWSMRFESKHRELKAKCNQLAGTINICKSIAIDAQHKIAHKSRSFDFSVDSYSKKMRRNVELLSFIPSQYKIHGLQNLFSCVAFRGIKYRTSSVVVIRFSAGEPQFGKIMTIFSFNKTPMLVVENLQTVGFNGHYHAYNVTSMGKNDHFIVSLDTLPTPFPCSFVKKGGKSYVISKHVL